MSFVDRILKNPHFVLAFCVATIFGGWLSFEAMPLNLFPDTSRPVVSVITPWKGATSDDVATDVSHPIEVRLSAIDGVRRVTSTSRDEVSSVSVEFEYGVNIEAAATDVANELPRVRGILPKNVGNSLIFKVTDAAHPVVVLAVSVADDQTMSLDEVRLLAENPLRDALLGIEGIAEVEIFGGHKRELLVEVDRDLLDTYKLTVGDVSRAIADSNVSIPAGEIHAGRERILLNVQDLKIGPSDLGEILVSLGEGQYVRVSDIAEVHWSEDDPTALYRGNGHRAIAVSLLRSEQGNASTCLKSVEEALPRLRTRFPMLRIDIADTQGRLIDITVANLVDALRDALIMTLLVILLFIGNLRAAIITAVSLPLTYLLTFVVLRLLDFELDMVTLTAIIIAVGLLADDAVVVIENVERHMRELKKNGLKAAADATKEILLADASGTISTVIVLIPIMLVGGFVETVLRPLTVTLSVSLIASLVISVTIIPLLAAWFLNPKAKDPLSWVFRIFAVGLLQPARAFYGAVVSWGLGWRFVVLLGALVLFGVSARQMPVLGRELMPLMDTGVIQIHFEAEPDTDDQGMSAITKQVESMISEVIPTKELLTISAIVGSEPGVKSFGAARTLQQGDITVNIVDRLQRERSIYDFEEELRSKIRSIPGLITADVFEFGATAVTSLRGCVDVMVTGPDPVVLDGLADDVLHRMAQVPGMTGSFRTWHGGAKRWNLKVDATEAKLHRLSASDVATQVSSAVSGQIAGFLRVESRNPIPIRVRLPHTQTESEEQLDALQIRGTDGKTVPLVSMAKMVTTEAHTAETHQNLLPTVDVVGYRRNISVTALHENIKNALSDLVIPRDYALSFEGEINQMDESFGRLLKALVIGLVLLYFMLVVTFKSFLDPLAIMGTLPLALIGAAWAMLAADKHGCLPSFMGFILLMGIVVNNGILLVDFAKLGIEQGQSLRDAILAAVKVRTRPILMTAGASVVGMVPIALEWAAGIERLSPLAVVAIGGLIAGTFLTLLVVPVLFHLIESMRRRFGYGLSTTSKPTQES